MFSEETLVSALAGWLVAAVLRGGHHVGKRETFLLPGPPSWQVCRQTADTSWKAPGHLQPTKHWLPQNSICSETGKPPCWPQMHPSWPLPWVVGLKEWDRDHDCFHQFSWERPPRKSFSLTASSRAAWQLGQEGYRRVGHLWVMEEVGTMSSYVSITKGGAHLNS